MKFFLIFFLLFWTTNGISIKCTFITVNWIVFDEDYTCFIAPMDAQDGNSTHITTVTTEAHLSGKNNTDVVGVWTDFGLCQDFHLETIPKGFAHFFPNLYGIKLNGCSFNHLKGDELNEYPMLKYFGAHESNLKEVPATFFAKATNVRGMDFGSNKIELMEVSVIENLSDLVYADFSKNICIDKLAETPSDIAELKQLIKHQCGIFQETTTLQSTTTINPECFTDCNPFERIQVLRKKNQKSGDKIKYQVEMLSEIIQNFETNLHKFVKRMEKVL